MNVFIELYGHFRLSRKAIMSNQCAISNILIVASPKYVRKNIFIYFSTTHLLKLKNHVIRKLFFATAIPVKAGWNMVRGLQ